MARSRYSPAAKDDSPRYRLWLDIPEELHLRLVKSAEEDRRYRRWQMLELLAEALDRRDAIAARAKKIEQAQETTNE